jgi:hypothetical protein
MLFLERFPHTRGRQATLSVGASSFSNDRKPITSTDQKHRSKALITTTDHEHDTGPERPLHSEKVSEV